MLVVLPWFVPAHTKQYWQMSFRNLSCSLLSFLISVTFLTNAPHCLPLSPTASSSDYDSLSVRWNAENGPSLKLQSLLIVLFPETVKRFRAAYWSRISWLSRPLWYRHHSCQSGIVGIVVAAALCVWSLPVHPVCAWVHSTSSGFLPPLAVRTVCI